jgi:hypothetical protein
MTEMQSKTLQFGLVAATGFKLWRIAGQERRKSVEQGLKLILEIVVDADKAARALEMTDVRLMVLKDKPQIATWKEVRRIKLLEREINMLRAGKQHDDAGITVWVLLNAPARPASAA